MIPASTIAAQGTKRLHLLDAAEVAALYERPYFTDEECAYYFALTRTDMAHMQAFTDGAVQAFFVLQLGYFKAKQRFFSVKRADVLSDLIFIVNQFGSSAVGNEQHGHACSTAVVARSQTLGGWCLPLGRRQSP